MDNNKNFRYDINALRAVAVTGVLLFHYKVPFFNGGFAGVDVFFVISGYLMTRIILGGINKGAFSVWDFYARRLKRIVPALLALVSVLTVIGFFTYFPDDYQLNEKNALSSVLFLSNIYYWLSSGYFAEASDSNILLHTWSLSVEWQFYLVYPLILLLLSRYVKKRAGFLFGFTLTLVLLFAFSLYYTAVNPEAGFYLLPSRAWEMLLGGVAFLAGSLIKHAGLKRMLSIMGYSTIAISFILLNDEMQWPGNFTLIPALATFIIILTNSSVNVFERNRVIQFIGRISYSLYLWHWPVYVIAGYIGFEAGWRVILSMFIISGVLGYLSYRYIESVNFATPRILTAMIACAAAVAVFAFIDTNQFVFKSKALYLADYKTNHAATTRKRLNTAACPIPAGCLQVKLGMQNILLIGDSHAAHIWQPLKDTLASKGINLIKSAGPSCRPILSKSARGSCRDAINYIYKDFIAKNAVKLNGVMISINWVDVKNRKQFISDLRYTIRYLQQKKLRTILIGQNETYDLNYPTIKAREIQYDVDLTKRYLDEQSYEVNSLLKSKFKRRYVEIINMRVFPPLSSSNIPYMIDENHFTEYGAKLVVRKMLKNGIMKRFLCKGEADKKSHNSIR